jgi:hypothetical protein
MKGLAEIKHLPSESYCCGNSGKMALLKPHCSRKYFLEI